MSRRDALKAALSVAGAAACAWPRQGVAQAAQPSATRPTPPWPTGKPTLWHNWSGLQTCQPSGRLMPGTPAELATWLRSSSGPLRCVGSGHSFTGLVPTSGTLISLDRLSGVVHHDASRQQVTVRAGTRLAVLNSQLSALGLALHNLPDINVQTLAGALSTATHGTGARLPALHHHLTGLRLMTVQGELIHCSRDTHPELFAAARVSLGALGVITEFDLSVRPQYHLRKRVWTQPTEHLLEQADTLAGRHRNFEFYVLPHTGMAAGITHDEVAPGTPIPRHDADEEALMDLKRLRDHLSGWPGLRRWLATRLIGEGEQEVAQDMGWKLLSSVRNTRFNETEFHVPRAQGLACLRQILQALEKRPDVFFPLEFRYVLGDDAWLSPFQGRDSCSIAVHAMVGEEHRYLIEALGPIFRRHGGRPHWGKLHDLPGAELATHYPRWKDFQALRATLDPQGRLLNPYLKQWFGARA
ncbi:MAG TPA: D-arabinono-1,4-lactone oxidase [Aquabacterium sp.]|uniref:D-arabinono-1,4-lactone oxidase n=1 Tax=Aquabacterium sp. TaxID=1872578 RepID=UPI002E2EEA98|nr:D-arabinono-1,4-lactone oxidase [Aquabacterium sp.]HEX5371575.1 D-arabinono-1,4-lactone oxidase [Aquabacterium sp.]